MKRLSNLLSVFDHNLNLIKYFKLTYSPRRWRKIIFWRPSLKTNLTVYFLKTQLNFTCFLNYKTSVLSIANIEYNTTFLALLGI